MPLNSVGDVFVRAHTSLIITFVKRAISRTNEYSYFVFNESCTGRDHFIFRTSDCFTSFIYARLHAERDYRHAWWIEEHANREKDMNKARLTLDRPNIYTIDLPLASYGSRYNLIQSFLFIIVSSSRKQELVD